MRTLTPIGWAEGMFLKPHHFQQADLYQDTRLGYHLRALNAFHWGVFKLRVDVDALENLIFRVLQCEVVLPDGLVFRFPEDALLEEKSFQDEFPPTANALGVFLAVRTLTPEDGATERFARQAEPRRDLLMRDNEASIDFLVPRAQLLFGQRADDERLAGFQAIKITEIRRTGKTAPRFELSPHYAPPALSLHAAPRILAAVNEVVERCCAASRTLGQHRRERGPEAMGYGVGDFEQLLGRQMINQYVPELQHALLSESIHPFFVYGLLVGLRGALTSYWPDEEAWTFPVYQHDDLATCFGKVCESISRLLERLLPVRYREVPLERSGFQFSGALDEVVLTRGTYWVLAISGTVPEEELRRRIETQAKVSSVADMRQLVNIQVRGVTLKYLQMPPAEMPRYAGWHYFQVETADRGFAKIKDSASFAFYLQDAEPDLEARLMVVLGEEKRR